MSFKTTYNPETKIWSGPKVPTNLQCDIALGKQILQSLEKNPDNLSEIHHDLNLKIYNSDIRNQSIRVAQNLMRLGVEKGDVITLILRSSPILGPIFYGSILIGAPVNPLDGGLDAIDIGSKIELIKPKIIIFDEEFSVCVKSVLKTISYECILVCNGKSQENCLSIKDLFKETGLENEFIPPDLDTKTTVLGYLCSSGTTGSSKLITLSQHNLLNALYNPNHKYQDICLSFGLLHWYSGFYYYLSTIIYQRIRISTSQRFSAELTLELLEKYKVTSFQSDPFILIQILQSPKIKLADLSNLKEFLVVGSPLAKEFQEEMEKYLPNGKVGIVYASTEISFVSAVIYGNKEGSCGQLAERINLKICDEKLNLLGPNQIGELFMEKGSQFLGYYQNEAATKDTFDEEGWLISGDLGYIDDDGFLFLVGRNKEMVKYCGNHVSLCCSYLNPFKQFNFSSDLCPRD